MIRMRLPVCSISVNNHVKSVNDVIPHLMVMNASLRMLHIIEVTHGQLADLIFLIVVDNLNPPRDDLPGTEKPSFSREES